MSDADGDLVLLTLVYGDPEALVIQSLLESNGIGCVLQTHVVHSVHPFTVDGAGMVKILVAKEDVAAARLLLEQAGQATEAGDE
jgi:hypothetical protein